MFCNWNVQIYYKIFFILLYEFEIVSFLKQNCVRQHFQIDKNLNTNSIKKKYLLKYTYFSKHKLLTKTLDKKRNTTTVKISDT
jgi:hypothetical protein